MLNNWLHHRDRDYERGTNVDPYSSGASFLGWKELGGTKQFDREEGFEPVSTAAPALWLTREGWKRGGEISVFAISR